MGMHRINPLRLVADLEAQEEAMEAAALDEFIEVIEADEEVED